MGTKGVCASVYFSSASSLPDPCTSIKSEILGDGEILERCNGEGRENREEKMIDRDGCPDERGNIINRNQESPGERSCKQKKENEKKEDEKKEQETGNKKQEIKQRIKKS